MKKDMVQNDIMKKAIEILKAQPSIPAVLFDTREGYECMCVGGAVLYAAYLWKGGSDNPKVFFERNKKSTELNFVKCESKKLGLKSEAIWNIMEISKVLSEEKRMEMAEFNISKNLEIS